MAAAPRLLCCILKAMVYLIKWPEIPLHMTKHIISFELLVPCSAMLSGTKVGVLAMMNSGKFWSCCPRVSAALYSCLAELHKRTHAAQIFQLQMNKKNTVPLGG